MNKIYLVFSLMIGVTYPAFAKQKSILPKLLEEVEAKYTQAATLTAEFTQTNETAILKQKKVSSGHIFIKRPNKIRWETLQPDVSLLVSNGRTFWFYTPPFDKEERGQLIERKTSEAQSKLASALLSGSFSMAREMRIKQQSPQQFILIPKIGSAGTVSKAEIQIDPGKKLIQNVTLRHQGGNRSEIILSHIELGKPLEDDIFIFTPPPNTDRIKE